MVEEMLYPGEIKALHIQKTMATKKIFRDCKELTLNCIMCLHCSDIIVSEKGDDLKWCKCGKVAIHGEMDYLRRTGVVDEDYEELSIWKP